MHRVFSRLPQLALVVAAVLLLYAGLSLRETASETADRQARRDFAAAVQAGNRPEVASANMGGVLRQELDAQEVAAATRARLALWLQVAGALSILGFAVSLATVPAKPNRGTPVAAA